jgi:DNA-directed RNA polymerase specialized sigma24 family protein
VDRQQRVRRPGDILPEDPLWSVNQPDGASPTPPVASLACGGRRAKSGDPVKGQAALRRLVAATERRARARAEDAEGRLEQRAAVREGRAAGVPYREMAAVVGRSPGTISGWIRAGRGR